MHFWIDIENPKHISFFKSLIKELVVNGHYVTVTAPKSKKLEKALKENNIKTNHVGFIISIFGLVIKQSIMLRSVTLSDLIRPINPDSAISLGGKTILYTSSFTNTPIITILEDYKEKIDELYFIYGKSFFMVPDNIPDLLLIEKKFNIDRVAKYKGSLKRDNPNIKTINEIIKKIEKLPLTIQENTIA